MTDQEFIRKNNLLVQKLEKFQRFINGEFEALKEEYILMNSPVITGTEYLHVDSYTGNTSEVLILDQQLVVATLGESFFIEIAYLKKDSGQMFKQRVTRQNQINGIKSGFIPKTEY